MQQRLFAATGRNVSEVGLGTWQLGGTEWGDVSDEQAIETLAAAADAGVTFLDTADIYGAGRSETLIGRFLQSRADRDRFLVATKLGRRSDPGWPDNFRRATIQQHTEDSLRRLQVDTIDLTQLHCVPMKYLADGDVWGALGELKRAGKIRAFGASVETMDEALECLKVEGLASLQIIFNVFRQKPIDDLFAVAKAKGVSIIVRLPLASGLLSGNFNSQTQFATTDHRSFNRDGQKFNVGETFAGLPLDVGLRLIEQLRPHVPAGWSMAEWALRWCLDFPEVTTVIPGAKRPAQARQNASAANRPPLSKETHQQLRDLYQHQIAQHIRGPY